MKYFFGANEMPIGAKTKHRLEHLRQILEYYMLENEILTKSEIV